MKKNISKVWTRLSFYEKVWAIHIGDLGLYARTKRDGICGGKGS